MIITSSDEKLQMVVCECGFKLLVVPDLDEMASCIMVHAETHRKAENDQQKAEAEYCRIEELLTQKVLISISQRSSDKSE